MKEVLVKCLVNRYTLADLKIHLVRDQTAHITPAQAAASTDLDVAKRSRAVSVKVVALAKEVREHPRALRTPPIARVAPPKFVPRQDKARRPPLDKAAVKEIVDAVVKERLAQFRLDFMSDFKEVLSNLQLNPTVVSAPACTVAKAASTPTFQVEPEPMFIPSNIVDDTADVGLNVEAKAHDGLDEAQAALRKMKRNSKEK